MDNAVELLGPNAVPPGVTIETVNRPTAGWAARTVAGNTPGTYIIYLNIPTLIHMFPDLKIDTTGDFAGGALCGTIEHELIHARNGGATGGCEDGDFSCDHYATYAAQHSKLCELSAECKAAYDAAPPSQQGPILEKLFGLCMGAKEVETKWNSSQGADAAEACYGASPPCPFVGGASGVTMPPPPPGGDFPNDVVIPPCPACQQLGF